MLFPDLLPDGLLHHPAAAAAATTGMTARSTATQLAFFTAAGAGARAERDGAARTEVVVFGTPSQAHGAHSFAGMGSAYTDRGALRIGRRRAAASARRNAGETRAALSAWAAAPRRRPVPRKAIQLVTHLDNPSRLYTPPRQLAFPRGRRPPTTHRARCVPTRLPHRARRIRPPPPLSMHSPRTPSHF